MVRIPPRVSQALLTVSRNTENRTSLGARFPDQDLGAAMLAQWAGRDHVTECSQSVMVDYSERLGSKCLAKALKLCGGLNH